MGVDSDERAERDLGVIEAITQVTRSCPSGAVVAAAERALEAIKQGGPEVLRPQAYFVLTAIKGWRGERARQVHRSLTRFLESPARATTGPAEVAPPTDPPSPTDPSPPRTRS
jgi:hypothetical protein